MHNFELALTTKLYFGKDEHLKIGEIVRQYGFKNVLLLYGKQSAVQSGLLEVVTRLLMAEGINYTLYGGISPNPEIHYVREALDLARKSKAQLIIALGGGSIIDVAKTVSVAYAYEGDPLDFPKRLVTPTKGLPIGVILTHASAGSEMSASAVISEQAKMFKQGFRSHFIRPLFAITNPELTYTLSFYQTAVGIVDSFMHSLERYFCASPPLMLADRFSEAIFITLIEAANVLLNDEKDYNARANLMLASTMTHNDLTGMGKKTTMSAHALEHAVSALYPHVIHGHGLAIIWPAWARFYLPLLPDKFDRFARNVFKFTNDDKIANGEAAIKALEQLFAKLGLSSTLASVGVKREDIRRLAQIVVANKTHTLYHDAHQLTEEEIIKIYESCY